MELKVSFCPTQEGPIQESLQLKSEDGTIKPYAFCGKGNMVELDVVKLEGKEFNPNIERIKKIYFPETLPTLKIKKILSLKNMTLVKVKYHWQVTLLEQESLYRGEVNNISQETEKGETFTVHPAKGEFNPDETIDFEIEFKGSEVQPYYAQAEVIVDDIPIESIKNKEVLNLSSSLSFSKNKRTSLPYFQFHFISRVNGFGVNIEPSIYIFPQSLYINKTYSKTFVLQNLSTCDITYSIIPLNLLADKFSLSVPNQTV